LGLAWLFIPLAPFYFKFKNRIKILLSGNATLFIAGKVCQKKEVEGDLRKEYSK